jgi:polysaccharide biosynthesis protein PslA
MRLRGPLRPAQLLTVRQRHNRRLAAHAFRTVDVLLIVLVTTLTCAQAWDTPLLQITLRQALPLAAGAALLLRLVVGMGLYSLGRKDRLAAHLATAVVATIATFAATALLDVAITEGRRPFEIAAVWALLCGLGLVILHVTWWTFVHRWRRDGWLTPNVVIVGATAHAENLISAIIERQDMHVLGIFDDRLDRSPSRLLGVPILGNTDALVNHRIVAFVDLIVIAVDPTAIQRIREITSRLSVLPNRITLLFDDLDATNLSAALADLGNGPLAPLRPAVDGHRRAFAKRLQDLLIGVPALIILGPIMLCVAVAVRLDSRGPIFFRQHRHGFNNEEIVVWKFRTMRHEVADARAERQVSKNDDRVTRIGRFLRTTSLDELPQLFNVIRGEMSIVGPRPHAIGMKSGEVQSSLLVAEYAHRHRIKPGMTGWAAVNGSRGALVDATDVGRRVKLDIEYIDRQSLWLDFRIIALTVPRMLGDRTSIR